MYFHVSDVVADFGPSADSDSGTAPGGYFLCCIADDHSRVHLHPTQGQKKYLDYINANFIDGYQKSRAFIGTQGPLPDTFDCFWRMIWEQRVSIIVMITNLVERGRRKCDMYWPKEGTEVYGVIQVKLISEEVMATYTVRTFHIKHLKVGVSFYYYCISNILKRFSRFNFYFIYQQKIIV